MLSEGAVVLQQMPAASRNGAQEDIQPHHQQDCIYNAHPNTILLLLFETNVNTPVALSRSG